MEKKLKAFTLAEVLITLAIIGVVAALTIPTLVTSYQKKMYVTQLKKSYNNLSNGFKTIMANDGVTKLSDTTLWSKIPRYGSTIGNGSVGTESANIDEYKPFFEELQKTFKTSAIYGEGDLPQQYNFGINGLNGEDMTGDEKLKYGLFLADGSFFDFTFGKLPDTIKCHGSSYCTSLSEFQKAYNTKTKLWELIGVVYIDVNGIKGPNTFGRDLFEFQLGNDGTLYPYGGIDYAIYRGCSKDDLTNCIHYWKSENNDSSCNPKSLGEGCAGRVMEEGWQMNY